MKFNRFTGIWIILAALLLTACAAATSTPTLEPTPTTAVPTLAASTEISLTDGLGRSVTLPSPAERVISLSPSNTEILYAVGAGEALIARDEFSNYPAEAAGLPSIGGSMSDYNLEEIVKLEPDLILAAEINTPELVKSLEDLGLTVYYLSNPTDLDGMYELLRQTATLVGTSEQTETLIASLQTRVTAVQEALATVKTQPKVFYELDGSDASAPWTSGPDTFMDTLIQSAGGQNVASDLSSGWAQISQEALLVANPDFIVLGDAAYGVTAEQVSARPGWGAIQAVKTGTIYPFNDDLVSRPGPRMVDGLEELAKIIHPEAFQ